MKVTGFEAMNNLLTVLSCVTTANMTILMIWENEMTLREHKEFYTEIRKIVYRPPMGVKARYADDFEADGRKLQRVFDRYNKKEPVK